MLNLEDWKPKEIFPKQGGNNGHMELNFVHLDWCMFALPCTVIELRHQYNSWFNLQPALFYDNYWKIILQLDLFANEILQYALFVRFGLF